MGESENLLPILGISAHASVCSVTVVRSVENGPFYWPGMKSPENSNREEEKDEKLGYQKSDVLILAFSLDLML